VTMVPHSPRAACDPAPLDAGIAAESVGSAAQDRDRAILSRAPWIAACACPLRQNEPHSQCEPIFWVWLQFMTCTPAMVMGYQKRIFFPIPL
jgi:hypothetical protein